MLRGQLRLQVQLRHMLQSLHTSMHHLHISKAQRLQLHPTDLTCLLFLRTQDTSTPGDISAHCSITSGATTTMLGRLEKAGYIKRLYTTEDRRKVHVQLQGRKVKNLDTLEETLHAEYASLLTRYSLEELAIIKDFLSNTQDLFQQQQAKITS